MKRREIWLPTFRGWVVLTVIALALGLGAIVFAVPFLSPVLPLHRGTLVVVSGVMSLHISAFDDWVPLDLECIDHWSIWLDLKILLRTVWVVVAGTGK